MTIFSFRPLIGVSFCKHSVISVDIWEPQKTVFVPLSGLVSVNKSIHLIHILITIVFVPLSGLVSVNDMK